MVKLLSVNPKSKGPKMDNKDFNPTTEANSISKAISSVLEQQQVEWCKQGIDLNLTYTACLIGLAQAVYDEISNFSAIKYCMKHQMVQDEYIEFYNNNTCIEALVAYKSILKTGKDVLSNKATWQSIDE